MLQAYIHIVEYLKVLVMENGGRGAGGLTIGIDFKHAHILRDIASSDDRQFAKGMAVHPSSGFVQIADGEVMVAFGCTEHRVRKRILGSLKAEFSDQLWGGIVLD